MADQPRRWREWALAIAGAYPCGRPGVTRRRAPLKLALLRRSRCARWMTQHNVFLHRSGENHSIVVKPVLRLSLQWTRTVASFSRSSAPMLPPAAVAAAPGAGLDAAPAAPIDLIHRWSLREQHTRSRMLLREIVERTRRLEERVRVDKRLVVRGTQSASTAAEQQDAARRSGPDWWKSDPPVRNAHATTASPVNVDQIAENVMRRLDQRMSAWRERMGRV